MNIVDIIILLGGVALFLFGMSMMGDGLKKVAGNRLELILYRLSSTTLRGVLLGTGVTAVIQSSSATSVMVVGFVNSGMMRLRQAIAVILGAVLGTSVTGWVICLSGVGGENASIALQMLSTETLSALVAIAGILLRMIGKKKSSKSLGDILMGFAVLMFGMKTMSGAVAGLRSDPAFLSFVTSFSNPLIGVLVGLVMTAILQSASAAVGILQALSSTGLLTFAGVLPVILGIAVGASIPVLLSGMGSSREGKEAALSYLVIEIIRSLLFGVVFYALDAFLSFSFMNMTMNMFSVALLNTLFRLITVIALMPFVGLIEKLIRLVMPAGQGDESDARDMDRLEERFLAYPTLAVEQSRLAVNRMAELTREAMRQAMDLLETFDEKGFREVERMEELVDRYEDKIGSYLMKVTGRELNGTQNKAVSQYLRAITDLERISDHALNIAEGAQEMAEKKVTFSDKAHKEMENLSAAIREIMDIAFESFLNGDADQAFRVEPLEQVIDKVCQRMRQRHAARLQKGKCTFANGYVFNDLIADMERVADHCSNISIVLLELQEDAMDVHELSGQLRQTHPHHFEEYFEEYQLRYLPNKKEELVTA